MKPLRLARVRAALIVAPHPDDESIGAYGLIRALKARRARVRVLVVTDGARSHPNSVRWPRRRLVAERRRETLAAMRRIGVPATEVTFMGLADGQLPDMPTALTYMLRRALAGFAECDLAVLPACDDDHPDHRAVAAALSHHHVRKLHYLVWPNRRHAPRRANRYLRLGPVAAAKRGAIKRYRSQMGVISDDPQGFAITPTELAIFARPVECFRELQQ